MTDSTSTARGDRIAYDRYGSGPVWCSSPAPGPSGRSTRSPPRPPSVPPPWESPRWSSTDSAVGEHGRWRPGSGPRAGGHRGGDRGGRGTRRPLRSLLGMFARPARRGSRSAGGRTRPLGGAGRHRRGRDPGLDRRDRAADRRRRHRGRATALHEGHAPGVAGRCRGLTGMAADRGRRGQHPGRRPVAGVGDRRARLRDPSPASRCRCWPCTAPRPSTRCRSGPG